MPESDFDLVDGLCLRIADKKEKLGLNALKEEERVIVLVWHASGIIENGGFMYFYESGLDAEEVAWAYAKIDCDKCAEILRMSLSLFPDSLRQKSGDERVEYIERNKELFYNLSSLFWDADLEMLKRMAEYVRTNADKICN
ncbi:MAG: DUF4375 domain-containing protein [Verrucomicrobiota bacterium]